MSTTLLFPVNSLLVSLAAILSVCRYFKFLLSGKQIILFPVIFVQDIDSTVYDATDRCRLCFTFVCLGKGSEWRADSAPYFLFDPGKYGLRMR